jgi:hypothetical protein
MFKFKACETEKCVFTIVNDHFEDKRNAEVGHFLRAQSNSSSQSLITHINRAAQKPLIKLTSF